ncbi:MAG: hypothetical protein GC190_14350 [Alphaproteobacteria bacterium]|nr:hypothetical protein [Alphaproteobacteria bacterium]
MRLVVVTGASRSGTTFLGGLLDRAENATSRHEYLTSREFSYVSYYNPRHPALRRDIEERAVGGERLAAGSERFVDVNCNLAFGLQALREARPDAQIFHLVRDGRAVVTSNWSRKMYTPYSKGISLVPNTEEELKAWEGYDRFQRLAWQWNHIVSHLLAERLPIIKLEHALEDYGYLKARLLDPAGIVLSQTEWENRRKTKANGSRFKIKDLLRGRPSELEWTAERRRQFDEICGGTMHMLGYSNNSAPVAAPKTDAMAARVPQQAAE